MAIAGIGYFRKCWPFSYILEFGSNVYGKPVLLCGSSSSYFQTTNFFTEYYCLSTCLIPSLRLIDVKSMLSIRTFHWFNKTCSEENGLVHEKLSACQRDTMSDETHRKFHNELTWLEVKDFTSHST